MFFISSFAFSFSMYFKNTELIVFLKLIQIITDITNEIIIETATEAISTIIFTPLAPYGLFLFTKPHTPELSFPIRRTSNV